MPTPKKEFKRKTIGTKVKLEPSHDASLDVQSIHSKLDAIFDKLENIQQSISDLQDRE